MLKAVQERFKSCLSRRAGRLAGLLAAKPPALVPNKSNQSVKLTQPDCSSLSTRFSATNGNANSASPCVQFAHCAALTRTVCFKPSRLIYVLEYGQPSWRPSERAAPTRSRERGRPRQPASRPAWPARSPAKQAASPTCWPTRSHFKATVLDSPLRFARQLAPSSGSQL